MLVQLLGKLEREREREREDSSRSASRNRVIISRDYIVTNCKKGKPLFEGE